MPKIEAAGFKDPHVFPFVVKGWKPGRQLFDEVVVYESRRTKIEAEQTAQRFAAQDYAAYVFELKLVDVTVPPVSVVEG